MVQIRFLGGQDNENSVDYFFNTKGGAIKERARLRAGYYDKSDPHYWSKYPMKITKTGKNEYRLRVYDNPKYKK